MMPKISAVINTRNEEKNIRYCLETVKWCDEIVVVDMESEDRTVEIVKEYTNFIYSYKKTGYVESAREFAVDRATGDWILIIDADEMIPVTLAENLKNIAEKNEVDIVEVPFKHYIMGNWVRYSGWGYSPLPRFFRRGRISFTSKIHSGLQKLPGARTVLLDNPGINCIEHFNYRDSAHFVEKLNRYTSVEAEHLYDRGQQFRYGGMFRIALREFHGRYVKGKGYRDGVRGFALCTMMAFYRILTYIKLWELQEFHDDSVETRYNRLRESLISDWKQRLP